MQTNMNNDLSSTGRGNYANTPPQAAQNVAKTSSTADDRCFGSAEIFNAHISLFMVVDGLFDEAQASSFVEAINHTLLAFLRTPGLNIESISVREQVALLLDLSLVIVNLSERLDSINAAHFDLRRKGEVSNG